MHEVFVEPGLEIKRRSPFPDTMVFSLADDMDFTTPTRKAFDEWSDEVTTCPLVPGCGDALVEPAIKAFVAVAP